MRKLLISILLCGSLSLGIAAQTTEFTYQGSLKDGANLANGNYDFEFLLFDALSSGSQVGSTLTRSSVAVSSGIFSVSLDFGSEFPGASRFLEIHVRPTGGGSFNTLSPRQQIDSAPYSVRSLNAATADSVTAGGIPAGSGNYVQNQNVLPQASTDFNISGSGTANIFSAGTQYNIGGTRILSNAGTDNIFVGFGSGSFNTGRANSFFGRDAGYANNTGEFNSFFGGAAGYINSSGSRNAFFGADAGSSNSIGSENTFVGTAAGYTGFNFTGNGNTAFGYFATFGGTSLVNANAIGHRAYVSQNNSLVLGSISGINGASADTNVGIGTDAPGLRLDVVGRSRFRQNRSDTGTTNSAGFWLFQNTPNDDRAFVGMENDNNVGFYGGGAGWGLIMNVVTGNIGMGIPLPESKLHVDGNSEILSTGSGAGLKFRDRGSTSSGDDWVWYSNGNIARFFRAGAGDILAIKTDGSVGIGTTTPSEKFHVVGKGYFTGNVGIGTPPTPDRLFVSGTVALSALGSTGATSLCYNVSNQIATCSSSLRYKTNIGQFSQGMTFVNKLRPISFDWKEGGMKDVGFGAEDIEKIDPRFVTYNSSGEVEGVKYDRLSVAFVNAFREQQEQIEKQQNEINELRQIVCQLKPDAKGCTGK